MIVADLPPLEQDRIVCSISAAEAYAIPADIMLAIAEIEGGKPPTELTISVICSLIVRILQICPIDIPTIIRQ